MIKYLTILLFLLSSAPGFGQTYSLNDFAACDTPAAWSDAWYTFNNATDKEFVFTLESGQIRISKYHYSPVCEFAIPAGTLIGINKGEFGGGLYYQPTDSTRPYFVIGKNGRNIRPRFPDATLVPKNDPLHATLKDAKQLTRGNVKIIFTFNDSIYYAGGLSHMGLNAGGISMLRHVNDSFFIAGALDLGDAPAALAIHDDCIYLAGSKGFYLIDKKLQKKVIFDNLFWYGLYPTSVLVIDKRHVLVTIRGGYVRIDPEAGKLQLYKLR